MWLTQHLERRARKRRFGAAIAILLSANAYAKLLPPARLRVDVEFAKLLGGAGVSTVESRRFGSWSARALEHGWAMARLGMDTGLADVPWPQEFRRPRFFSPGPVTLDFFFRRSSVEALQAVEYLRARGADIPWPLPSDEPCEEALPAFSNTSHHDASLGMQALTPNPSIERTSQRPLRAPWSTAHVERSAP